MKAFSSAILVTLLALIPSVYGCSESRKATAPARVELPEIKVDSPSWDGVFDGKGPNTVVISAGDVRIPAWRIEKALAEAAPGSNPEEVARAVLAAELIAREAAATGSFVPERLVFEKALADRYLQKKLVEDFTFDRIGMDLFQETFGMPQIWARFNHPDLYEVQDYQWICCPDPNNCGAPEASAACFEEGEKAMRAVYEAVVRDNPLPSDMGILAPEYRRLAYKLGYQEYTFAFDRKAGHQKGLNLVDVPLADEIMKHEPGAFIPPVKSRFGWHVPYLMSHMPEEHRDISDPEVRKEIARVFQQRFRQHEYLQILARQMPVESLKLLQAYFEKRPRPEVPGVHDVKVFRDVLREEAAEKAAKKADQTGGL